MEAGKDFQYTTLMVNQHIREEDKIIVSRNSMIHHFDRMKPKLIEVMECLQASHNNQQWRNPRSNLSKQYSIIFGNINEDELVGEYHPNLVLK